MIAENIPFLRNTEHRAHLRRLISVLKLRTSDHDRALRDLYITRHGLEE